MCRPTGKQAWVANAGDGTVSMVDLAAKKLTDTLQANVNGANRLKFTPDGKLALISTLSGTDLTVIDVATRKVAKRLNVGRAAWDPDATRQRPRLRRVHAGELRRGRRSEIAGGRRPHRCWAAAGRARLGRAPLSAAPLLNAPFHRTLRRHRNPRRRGMGVVYAAFDDRLGRPVAIK
jgi:hypothetical protein